MLDCFNTGDLKWKGTMLLVPSVLFYLFILCFLVLPTHTNHLNAWREKENEVLKSLVVWIKDVQSNKLKKKKKGGGRICRRICTTFQSLLKMSERKGITSNTITEKRISH